jgi:NADH-quinone oxidoreductase subunit D
VSDLETRPTAPQIPYREMEASHEIQHLPHAEQELLTLNIGPHHPATHGVLRLLTTLEGEVVRDIKPIIGYVHTGIEKTAEDKAYWKVIPVVERMDYLAYYFNAMAFCGAVERLLELEVPKRGQYLRVLHMELNRIMSHLVWLGTSALDLGAISMFWYCFRDRETVLDLFEMSSGQRMHTRYIQVGGVMEDIPAGFDAKVRAFCAEMPGRVDQFLDLLAKNEIVLQRLRGVAAVDEQTLLGLGVTGPLLRATGNAWDLRKAEPYSSYDDFDFKIPVGTTGDNYDRFAARLMEIKESVKIIEQSLDGLPEGEYISNDRKYVLPPRHELATSMEALIHHFKLVTEGFRVPPGEVYYPIESPRGEMGCFVRADGSSKPARVHMRDPSFVNLQATKPMVQDLYIADLIATLAMLDPVLGGIDR